MGLQRTNHRGRIQRNNPIFIHYTKSNRPFRADSINRTIKKKNNLTRIYNELPSNFQFSADNGYSTDEKHNIS